MKVTLSRDINLATIVDLVTPYVATAMATPTAFLVIMSLEVMNR